MRKTVTCLECANWIEPTRWFCEKCEQKFIKWGEGYGERVSTKGKKRTEPNGH